MIAWALLVSLPLSAGGSKLSDFMSYEPAGCFRIEAVFDHHAPGQDDLDRALAHLREDVSIDPERPPHPALSGIVSRSFSFIRSEMLVCSDEAWKLQREERPETTVATALIGMRLSSSGTLDAWEVRPDGVRSQIARSWAARNLRSLGGNVSLIDDALRLVSSIVREAGRAEAPLSSQSFEVPLEVLVADEEDLWLPAGLSTSPGRADCRVSRRGRDLCVDVDLSDGRGSVLYSQKVLWTTDEPSLPRQVTVERFLPGTRRLLKRYVLSTATCSEEPDDSFWRLRPGEHVVDQRFLSKVDYHVAPDGSVPSEEEACLLADQQYEAVTNGQSFLGGAGTSLSAQGAGHLLRPSWDTIDLGEQRLGQWHRVRFELSNEAAEILAVTGVDAQCGCTQPEVSRREIAPGESVVLFASQQIVARGRDRKVITLRYGRVGAEKEEEVRLLVDYAGIEGPRLVVEEPGVGSVRPGQRLEIPFRLERGDADGPEGGSDPRSVTWTWLGGGRGQLGEVQVEDLVPSEGRVSGLLRCSAPSEYGHHEARVSMMDVHGEEVTTLIAMQVTPGGEPPWPACRLVLVPGETRSFRIPAARISAARGEGDLPTPEGLRLELDDGGLLITAGHGHPDLLSLDAMRQGILLATDVGPVHLLVTVQKQDPTQGLVFQVGEDR